jgi:hypothetical protein
VRPAKIGLNFETPRPVQAPRNRVELIVPPLPERNFLRGKLVRSMVYLTEPRAVRGQ